MSDDTRRVEEPSILSDSFLDLLEDWYHVPVLVATLSYMLWVRLQSYGNFVVDGQVYLSGNDPWYHLRQVEYTVQNWPATMPFDPWTGFPYGTSVGQFGTLFDQLMATVALIVGLGDPSEGTIAAVVLVTPAVFGALVAVPTYFVGKRLGGRLSGLFAAVVMALLPGLVLQRGVVGAADHNIAEPFFQATAVLAMMVAVSVAERERPIYEQVVGREFASLRRPLGYGVLAGLATALYLWVWPPGVVLVGIFGVFFVLKLSADFLRGVSPDHLAFVGATSMTVTALLSLIPMMETSFSAVAPSLVQPLLAFTVALGAVFMAWLARQWEQRDLSTTSYPVAVAGIILVGLLVVRFGIPDLFSMLRNNLERLFFVIEQSAAAGTVAEAQPFLSRTEQYGISGFWVVYLEYGVALFTAAAAAVWMVIRAFLSDEHDGQRFLVLVWFAMLASMAFTQVRFNYYLAVPVAALNGYLLHEVIRFIGATGVTVTDLVHRFLALVGTTEDGNDTNFGWYQLLTVVMVVLLVLTPLVLTDTVGSDETNRVQFSTAGEVGAGSSPGAVTNWADTLHWMRDNTPAEGTYGGADNEMDHYGTFERTDDYDYPAGSYGVMSWWDYGHWITTEAERIPNANPFQQQASDAANFLLAPNESAAESVRESLSENDAETRYVLVDWQMISTASKFGAPTVFYDAEEGVSRTDFYRPIYGETQRGVQPVLNLRTQRYYESTMIRLYRYHGSAMQPNPSVVVDWQPRRTQSGETFYFEPQGNRSMVRSFQSMAEARQFVQEDGSAQVGGVGQYPSEYVPAMEHYRLVQVSEAPAPRGARIRSTPSWVKAFERVPGATVEGEGPANATVTANAQMFVPNRNSTFVYTQRAETGPDGGFEMTLPYSTTGYDEFGPENGYTNVSVRATGPYAFTTGVQREGEKNLTFVRYSGSANVSEGQVVGADDSTVEVGLDRQVLQEPDGANNSTAPTNNSTAPPENGTAPTDNETAPTDNATGNDSTASVGGDAPAVDETVAGGPIAGLARDAVAGLAPDALAGFASDAVAGPTTPTAEPLARVAPKNRP